MTSNGDSPFDLAGFQMFRDACLDQYVEQQGGSFNALTDPLPTIVEALDAAIDEIVRLRALVDD